VAAHISSPPSFPSFSRDRERIEVRDLDHGLRTRARRDLCELVPSAPVLIVAPQRRQEAPPRRHAIAGRKLRLASQVRRFGRPGLYGP
jgi:hypothetical protein